MRFENAETTGCAFVRYVQDLVWALDPQRKTLSESVGYDVPTFVQKLYQARSGRQLGDLLPYNNYSVKKQPKPKLTQEMLQKLINCG